MGAVRGGQLWCWLAPGPHRILLQHSWRQQQRCAAQRERGCWQLRARSANGACLRALQPDLSLRPLASIHLPQPNQPTCPSAS